LGLNYKHQYILTYICYFWPLFA